LLSGTPTVSGIYVFLVKVVDGAASSNTASRQFTLNVTPISFTVNSTLPFGNVGTAYNETLTSTGGTGAITWTLAAGSLLPPGLSLAANGVLSGTPTEMGQYRFTVTATDTAVNVRSNTFNVSIYPAGTCGIITLSNTTFSNGPAGAPYSTTTITQTGGTAATTFAVTGGALPAGLSLSATGTVSGTPTMLGTFPFTVTATD